MADDLVVMETANHGITISVPKNEVTFFKNAGYMVVEKPASASTSASADKKKSGKGKDDAPAEDAASTEEGGGQ